MTKSRTHLALRSIATASALVALCAALLAACGSDASNNTDPATGGSGGSSNAGAGGQPDGGGGTAGNAGTGAAAGSGGFGGSAGTGGTGGTAGNAGTGGTAGTGGQPGNSQIGRVTGGLAHTCTVSSKGTLACWGENDFGQLGDGTKTLRPTPVAIGSDTDWKAVTAGAKFTCGLKQNGARYCWGNNGYGQIGNGGTSDSSAPVSTDTGWTRISAGISHACGLKTDGALLCWGNNDYGQAGEPTSSDEIHTPAPVLSGTKWIDVSAGLFDACGVTDAGKILCWGTLDALPPTQVGTDTDWVRVCDGELYQCGIRKDGSLWCWGENDRYQLGIGVKPETQTPVRVGTDNDWAEVRATAYTTCARKTSGQVHCWGWNQMGEAGVAITKDTVVLSSPTAVNLPTGNWVDLDLGGTRYNSEGGHGCAMRDDDALYCWGQGDRAQLGNGYLDNAVITPRQIGVDADWAAVTSGWARKTDGTVWYWGSGGLVFVEASNNSYSLTTNLLEPVPTQGATGSTSAGFGYGTCLVKTDGTLWCEETPIDDAWYNTDGVYASVRHPVQIGTASNWVSVSRGDGYQCAIDNAGALSCWGYNGAGELGVGDKVKRDVPTPVIVGGSWKKVATGHSHTCALRTNGSLWCWGSNYSGEVGNDTSGGEITTPEQIGTETDWTEITAGEWHSCGLRNGGKLYCWGEGGQVGDGSDLNRNAPVPIGTDSYKALGSAVYLHTCAIRQDGAMVCWGFNSYGQLGDQSTKNANAPVLVKGAADWTAVATGYSETCGIRTNGSVWCWGDNSGGGIGKPVTWRDGPEQVTIP